MKTNMENTPVVIITAKADSVRLPRKNLLPLGDKPLAMWSVVQGKQTGLDVVLHTNVPELAALGNSQGVTVTYHSSDEGLSHFDNIHEAMCRSGNLGRPCLLLQPTSPFRDRNIVGKCLEAFYDNPSMTVLTSQHLHDFSITDGVNRGEKEVWDGCVAIYPEGKLGNYDHILAVRNTHLNTLQIDREEDYIDACYAMGRNELLTPLYPNGKLEEISEALKNVGFKDGEQVNLVVRESDQYPMQERPTAVVNHAVGWKEGDRVDCHFIIANPELKRSGISNNMRLAAEAARLVVVRDHGAAAWLEENLPVIKDKMVKTGATSNLMLTAITTGVVAHELLRLNGCSIVRYGFGSIQHRAFNSGRTTLHLAGFSLEVAFLSLGGVDAGEVPGECVNGTTIGGPHHGQPCHMHPHHGNWSFHHHNDHDLNQIIHGGQHIPFNPNHGGVCIDGTIYGGPQHGQPC